MLNESRFKEAMNLKTQGDFRGALDILEDMHARSSHSPSLLAFCGDLHMELGNYVKATEAFRIAVKLAPTSETFSLGLFHCLWDANLISDALVEMKRFLLIAESAEYTRILAEICELNSIDNGE